MQPPAEGENGPLTKPGEGAAPRPLQPRAPGYVPSHPFTEALNSKLEKKIEPGKSIFDTGVISSYFDDPTVSEKDKQALLYGVQPSAMRDAFDKSIQKSVGDPVQSKGLLGRAISSFTDIAGKPIGKTFDALQWPADTFEQSLGFVTSFAGNSDLSLSERWRGGHLLYEAAGQSDWWRLQGGKQLLEWEAQVGSGEKTMDQLLAEHEHGVPDLVGKIMLDPLWALGGLPGIPGKLFKVGEKGAEVYKTGIVANMFRGLSEGIRVEQFGSGAIRAAGAFRRIPIVGEPISRAGRLMFGEFLPSKDKILANAMAEWRTALAESEVGPTVANWRSAKGLFELTAHAKADEVYGHFSRTALLAKASQEDLRGLARAIETGNLDAVPEVFGVAFRNKQGRILFQALKDSGIDLTKFHSMKMAIHPDQAVWDAAETGVKETTHRNADAFISAFQNDIYENAYPALQRWNGVPGEMVKYVTKAGEKGERFVVHHSPMEAFTGGLKFWLSVTSLNRPGFVGLNYSNNGSTLAADWGLSRGVKYWLDPFSRRGHLERGLKEVLEKEGITPDVVKRLVGDREMLLAAMGMSSPDEKLLGIAKKRWSPMVALASQLDMGARMHAFYEMYGRAYNSLGRFERQGGIIPDIPPELADQLGKTALGHLRGAILANFTDPVALRDIVKTMTETGRPPLTAEHFIEMMADQRGLEDDLRQAFRGLFEPAFKTRMNTILADAGSSTSRLARRLDTLRGAMRHQEHVAREMDQLVPRARDYRGLPTAMADHEALMGERDKTQLIQLRRYLTAVGDTRVDDALSGLAKVQNAARQRRYVLQYTSQLLGIAPDRLASDVMFQMVPEDLRPAVAAAHRDLVLGLDEGAIFEREGAFYEVLGDLSARWEKHSDQLDDDIRNYLAEMNGGHPLRPVDDGSPQHVGGISFGDFTDLGDKQDFREFVDGLDNVSDTLKYFFLSMHETERTVSRSRDTVFADMIRNHPASRGPESPGQLHPDTPVEYVRRDPNVQWEGAPSPESTTEEWVHTRWSEHYRELDNRYNDALQNEADIFGFEHRMPPHAVGGDNPITAEALGQRNTPLYQMIDHVQAQHLLERDSPHFSGDAASLSQYLDSVAAVSPDAKYTISLVARRAADYTMLNYERLYGIDHWMSLVYPYAFWPTRSMWHWAQRAASRPGATASTAMLYSLINEINTDAKIPKRFVQSIRMPIPFLDKSLQGGSMYFDPIKVLFPTADWSADNNFGDSPTPDGTSFGIPHNYFGAVNDWAKSVGPGVNLFIDTALQYLGGNDRALYLKYKLSSLPFMIPGPRQLQAAWSFIHAGEDPENLLDDSTKEALATGQHLPDSKLRELLGFDHKGMEDDYDVYRIQRVLSNQVDEMMQNHTLAERQDIAHQVLTEMFARKGPLWDNARKTSRHESGLAILTGWVFGVPVRQYPNGEATSRGIQALYQEAQRMSKEAGGGDVTAAFNKMFPEMEVKNAAVEIYKGTDKQDAEIAGALFAQNLDKVHAKYDAQITYYNALLTKFSASGLTTKDERRAFDVTEQERNALTQKRSTEIDNLNKLYDSRNQSVSLSRTPRTRGMQELETAYYAIELPDKPTPLDFDKQKAAQKAFIDALPRDQAYSPLANAVDHYAKMREFDHGISAAYDAGDRDKANKLIEERQKFVLVATATTKEMITQHEFRQYLDRNKRMPTSQELERDQASNQMSEYFAIKDRGGALGYSSRETAALASTYWKTHPLLEKFYGHDENISVHTFDDIQKYDRMEKIWDQFYATEGSSQARIDYLAMVLDELNGLRRHFGLPAVSITDPYWNHSAPPPRYEGSNPSGY